jgi:hypothetical protein
MLRAAAITSRRVVPVLQQHAKKQSLLLHSSARRCSSSYMLPACAALRVNPLAKQFALQPLCVRALSSSSERAANEAGEKVKDKKKQKTTEPPPAEEQKNTLKDMAYVAVFCAILALVGYCAYQLVMDLFPGERHTRFKSYSIPEL